MTMRLDRRLSEIPLPSDPDPVGASVVQELLGGKFGEISTFLHYTGLLKEPTGEVAN
jgi:Mn-containing catalase